MPTAVKLKQKENKQKWTCDTAAKDTELFLVHWCLHNGVNIKEIKIIV